MRKGIATVCLSGTLEEKLAAAAARRLRRRRAVRERPDRARRSRPPRCASRPPSSAWRSTSTSRSATSRRSARSSSRATCAAPRRSSTSWSSSGRRPMLVCSNVSPDADRRRRARRRAAAPRWPSAPRRAGCASPTRRSPGAATSSEYDHAWRIVERRRSSGARRLPGQLPHPLARHEPRRRSREIPADKLFFLQLADAPHLVMDVLQWSRHYRCFPGPGRLRPRRLHPPRARRRLRRPAVARGLQRRLPPGRPGADGDRRDALAADPRGARSRRARSRAPAPLDGYAFVELAVEPASAGETQRAAARARLRPGRPAPHQAGARCGGRATRACCSTPARREAPASPRSPSRAPTRTRGAARAEALLAPSSPASAARPRPTSRPSPRPTARRSSSAAPTAERRRLARRLRAARRGRGPRAACSSASTTSRSRSPFDSFDEAVLFYRSVLGLEPRESLELAAPDGLVRSRAVTSADGRVRLALNVPLAGRRPAQPAALQHVAFACADALAAARAHGRARRPAARDPRQLLRRPRRPHRPRRRA